jgi:hypothetical protein
MTDQDPRFSWLESGERFRRALLTKGDVDRALEELATAAGSLEASRTTDVEPGAKVQLSAPPKHAVLGPETTGIRAEARLRMTHVPLAIVHVLEPERSPLLSVELENKGDRDLRLRVRGWVEGYSAESVHTVEIPVLDEDQNRTKPRVIDLLPTFSAQTCAALHYPVRATVHVEVLDLDTLKLETHGTFRIWLLPRTTAIMWQKDPSTGEWLDRNDYLAGWVTPDDPDVMQILRKVAEIPELTEIVGYQVGAEGVRAQVRGMFDTLKAHGLKYVHSVMANGAKDVFVQRIRLPAESLRNRAANCIDGAVLYASLMEAASLQPAIVMVPGHAFVGWRKRESGEWEFLETTMTGYDDFDAALAEGRKEWAKLERKATLVDITKLRRHGYMAMG